MIYNLKIVTFYHTSIGRVAGNKHQNHTAKNGVYPWSAAQTHDRTGHKKMRPQVMILYAFSLDVMSYVYVEKRNS